MVMQRTLPSLTTVETEHAKQLYHNNKSTQRDTELPTHA